MPKKKHREVYDQNYYKAQEMLHNPWFKRKITWLKSKFKEFNCPVPKDGFKTLNEYMDWNRNKFWRSYIDIENSVEFKKEFNKITGGKSSWGSREQDEIEKLRLNLLPPVYGSVYDEILKRFGVDRKYKGFRDFLERHIFFNKHTYSTPLFSTHWTRNKKTNKMELFIRIFGHTRKEDLMNNWNYILKEQESLPDFQGKNKKWINFKRDNDIFELYLKLKRRREAKRSGKFERRIDEEIYIEIKKKHYDLSLGTIRSIIYRVKKFRVAPKGVA